MSKEYYVSRNESDFYVKRPNGDVFVRAANIDNAKYICAELNRLLHRIPAREEDEMELFPPSTLEDAIKNTEPAPKHDPRRLFRKGDKVRLVEWNGRKLWDDIKHLHRIYNEKGTFTVHDDEQGNDVVVVPDDYTENVYCACPACLELVTPVEELEPYVVRLAIPYGVEEWHVEPRNNNLALVAVFGHRHPHAKEAAQAECDRLNAAYRKEMEK